MAPKATTAVRRRSTQSAKSTPSTSTRSTPKPASPEATSRAAKRADRPTARCDDPLATYRARRDFSRTPEPAPQPMRSAPSAALAYFIQRHDARRLHYDFRLEVDGVLKSWAVPKGPSLDPAQKRLAVQTEDHPFDYGVFEGTIPSGAYGAGDVLLWDHGSWRPLHDPIAGLAQGKLHFELRGEKLAGEWVLVRVAARKSDRAGVTNWLLRKVPDAFARAGDDDAIVRERPESVLASVGRSARGHAAPTATTTTARKERLSPRRPRTGATSAPPEFIAPQLATQRTQPPREPGWVYEVKFDGYRMLACIDRGDVRIVSRNAQDWTARLPALAAALRTLDLRDAWLDGEITVAGAHGHPSFQALQNALDGAPSRIDYQLFDLLWLDGTDLRAQPLAARRARLEQIALRAPLQLAGQLDADGTSAWEAACRMQLEGLIGKRLDARYVSGRSAHWIKLKCRPTQEFVIGGWTDPAGSRELLGALLVGVHDGDVLRYAGRVGTGFTAASLRRLHAALAPLARTTSPFTPPPVPPMPRGQRPHWVQPKLVAQVEFAEWTDEGLLRQASFQGLRDDKQARAVVREQATTEGARAPAPSSASTRRSPSAAAPSMTADLGRITHPERPVYPDAGLTKLDAARYYAAMAPLLLADLRDRPLSLLRCPQGTQGTCFFQKHIATRLPAGLRHVTVQEKAGPSQYIAVADAAGIVALAQHGAIELHPWGSTAAALDRPDRLIIDLDPDDAIGWPTLLEAAWLTRTLLEELGLAAYVRTTGGKGLHVVTPLKPTRDWSTVKPFAQAIARRLEQVAPKRFTSTLAKEKRRDRVFIDYLRNAEGATAIASYSLRARPGAPVALPVAWDELKPKRDLRHDHFNLRNALAASQAAAQAWAGFAADARPITAAMLKALAIGR